MAQLYNVMQNTYTFGYNPVYAVFQEENLEEAIYEAYQLNKLYIQNMGIEVIDEDDANGKGYDVNMYKVSYIYTEDITPYVFEYLTYWHFDLLTKEQQIEVANYV